MSSSRPKLFPQCFGFTLVVHFRSDLFGDRTTRDRLDGEDPLKYLARNLFVNFMVCFAFTVDLLQMLEFNANVTFPVASFFTVILALVGTYTSNHFLRFSPRFLALHGLESRSNTCFFAMNEELDVVSVRPAHFRVCEGRAYLLA